jgi:N-acyl-L-homoserine lactone synthetase
MRSVLVHTRANPQASPALLESMFRLRCRVFKERLRWKIDCPGGFDFDDYDRLHPVYALYSPNRRRVEGCWRILPTTGPNMLRDIFPFLVDDGSPPVDDDIWEISRFAIDSLEPSYDSLCGLHVATSDLLIALVEFGMRYDIRRFVAASDVRFERILQRSGLQVHRLGRIQRVGPTPAVAGYIDVTVETLDRLHTVAQELVAKIEIEREREKVAA